MAINLFILIYSLKNAFDSLNCWKLKILFIIAELCLNFELKVEIGKFLMY